MVCDVLNLSLNFCCCCCCCCVICFPIEKRLFSAEELALYNGTDETLPILLGILG